MVIVVGYGPCSEAADGGVSLRKCDVREDITVDNHPGTRICRIVVGDSRVGFDFTYVCCEALCTRYTVLWRRILWLSIDVTSSGVDVVCWGAAVGPVMWSMDLFCGGRGLDGGAVSVGYDDLGNTGMSVWCMYACHVG